MPLTVASIFTTTPFLSPRDGWLPMPMISTLFSGVISATMATIFEVPISSATSRFFVSRGLFISSFPCCLVNFRRSDLNCLAQSQSAFVAQVSVQARQLQTGQPASGLYESLQPRFGVGAPQFQDSAVIKL